MKKLRVGFIGCGRHATKALYPSLRYAPVELVAVCDLDERMAERNACWFGASHSFTDHRRMLDACDLDAVLVVTGPATHATLATDILGRGLPVFVEKPPALTRVEAERLAEISKKAGQSLAVGLMKRHAPAYQRLKSMLASEDIGPISHIQAKFTIGSKKGSGYALLLDAGIHVLDLVRALGGDVAAIRAEKWENDAGVAYAINLRFESGAVGNVHISDQGSWFSTHEVIEITAGGHVLRAENLIRASHTWPDGRAEVWEPGFSIPQNQNNSLFIQGYALQFIAWVQALAQGRRPRPDIADACEVMRLIKALEPEELYQKQTQRFPHWQLEDAWLSVDDERT